MAIDESDLRFLARAVELAREALDAGDEPFGSVLVGGDGLVLREDRNRVSGGDETLHPEFELARWAARNMVAEERASATVYTSGEHCPMCSAAHAWVGLGRIVYAASAAQTSGWRAARGLPAGPVESLPISVVAPGVPVDGPAPQFEAELRDLFEQLAIRSLRRG
ncbi:nucleoside deaminase [Diaminobutyricibacter tongyongensis]|uniref:Nucleoside deaminase n=1 Tax=Leifsonia tongyongensis TaxID=1268043 RepID=A0A6L9Y1V8_9MICO|nr:nucleoside deaminase [Diaminobutyricibacter tongyongensis]NEN07254.1 nucleoside deaminase [Diaminobutyricibacter tongyongensis]